MKTLVFTLTICALFSISPAGAQQPTVAQLQFFETQIQPALKKYCYECHSVASGDSRAGLLVDSRQGLREGGDSGPAVVPNNLEDSVLWQAINRDGFEMPPSQKLPASVIADFRQWILTGAADPRERKLLHVQSKITAADIETGRKHWAFQPPHSRESTSIDQLVNARRDQHGLLSAAPADASTLLRRLNYDLIGLPPSPAEIQAFQLAYKRNRDSAIQAKVTELLKRPQYGERWGRHWLDVARYAESSGSRNISYPHAWRYRNYVIDSFNDDTPYDRFIAEQIAGDLLSVDSDQQWQENLIATGFLAIGMKHQDQKNPRKFLADMVDEQIDTTTQAILGLTVACARCHDHKYDPIPTHDYYALAGIFRSTDTYYGTHRVGQNHRPSDLLLLPIADTLNTQNNQRNSSLSNLKTRLSEIDAQLAQQKRGRNRRNDANARKEFKSLQNLKRRIEAQLATLNADGSKKTFGMGVQEAKDVVNANILVAGEVDQPAQQVPRGFVQLLGDLNFNVTDDKSSGRRNLAEALASKDNPLTARVMVNRIWMHLIGQPLVATPNNFGFSGMQPDHQELLDYLAVRFMKDDWSIKSLIREIVLSDTYQLSSQYNKTNYDVDPDNKLLWRANARQLDAESIRDSMLVLSGLMDLSRPSGSAVSDARGSRPGSMNIDPRDAHRSVYLPVIRDNPIEGLALFDFPDPNTSCAARRDSIGPNQALYVMNGSFTTLQAQSMSARLTQQHRSRSDQIRDAFLWAYGRPATADELQAAALFFREFKPDSTPSTAATQPSQQPLRGRRRTQAASGDAQRGRRRRAGSLPPNRNIQNQPQSAATDPALAVFCQTLMASARFRIVN